MNRTTAIVITIISALLCGLPGFGLICFATIGMVGVNMPGFYEQNPTATPEQAWLGAGMFLCLGGVLLVIPVLVGVFSFRFSRKDDETSDIQYIPPAS